jgi:hypothetical protein
VLTHLPPDSIPKTLPKVLQATGSDKIEHGVAYALIMMSVLSAVNRRRTWIIVVAIAVLGMADEITQPFFHRDCSVWDWMADLVGMAAAYAVALLNCCSSRTVGTAKNRDGSVRPIAPTPPIAAKPALWPRRTDDPVNVLERQE